MQAIKSRLKKNPIVRKVYSTFFGSKNNFSTQHWVSNYIPNESITVVQIGANDGISGDPLYQLAKENKAWNILFVEPCLLYTSPSPRDATLSRMPSSA